MEKPLCFYLINVTVKIAHLREMRVLRSRLLQWRDYYIFLLKKLSLFKVDTTKILVEMKPMGLKSLRIKCNLETKEMG